jgi:hypothetical protein
MIYTAFDEEWLDTALATAESMALAKVESGRGQASPRPAEGEDNTLQARQCLGHAKGVDEGTDDSKDQPLERLPVEESAKSTKTSPAVAQLRRITEQVERRLQTTREYLEWLPDGDQAPEPHADESTGDADGAQWRAPLDQTEPRLQPELTGADIVMAVEEAAATGGVSNPPSAASVLYDVHARLQELMEDVEYLHGAPGSPWLLMCRGSDPFFAGQPISYEDSYMDMIQTYRHAADTAMSIEDAAGIAHPHPRAVSKAWRVAERLAAALRRYWGRHPDPKPLIAIMTRKFEGLTRRLDAGCLKEVEASATHRMSNMLAQDVFTYGAYEVPNEAAAPPHHRVLPHRRTTKDGGAAWSQARTLVRARGDRTRRQHDVSHAWHVTLPHEAYPRRART